MADSLALEYLHEKQPISDSHILAVLSQWKFRPNKARLNVIPAGSEFVYSDTLGLVCDRRGVVCVDAATRKYPLVDPKRTYLVSSSLRPLCANVQRSVKFGLGPLRLYSSIARYPNVFRLLCAWLKCRRPASLLMDFPFTSISVNHNYAAKIHRDGHNAGVSLTRCFGDFERGGELTYWPDDDGRKLLEDLRENRSVTVDTRNNFTLFDGRRAHRVAAFTGGDRYSLVFFSVQSWATGPRDELPEGTTYPTDDSLRYFNRLVAPARGDAGSILAAFGLKPRPQILCWPRVNIDHLAATALRGIAAYTTRKKAKALRAVSRCFAQALLGGKKTRAKTRQRRSLDKKSIMFDLCTVTANS